jgi:hypothetical protein
MKIQRIRSRLKFIFVAESLICEVKYALCTFLCIMHMHYFMHFLHTHEKTLKQRGTKKTSGNTLRSFGNISINSKIEEFCVFSKSLWPARYQAMNFKEKFEN